MVSAGARGKAGHFCKGAQQEQRHGGNKEPAESVGTPTARDVGVANCSRRQGWRGGCTETQTKCFQAQRKRNCGKWKCLCGGGNRAWKTARTAAGRLG